MVMTPNRSITEAKWCKSVPSIGLAFREDFVCNAGQMTAIQQHLTQYCQGSAKASSFPEEKLHFTFFTHPKFPLALVWLYFFSFWGTFPLTHSCRTGHCGIRWPAAMAGGMCGSVWMWAGGKQRNATTSWQLNGLSYIVKSFLNTLHVSVAIMLHNSLTMC